MSVDFKIPEDMLGTLEKEEPEMPSDIFDDKEPIRGPFSDKPPSDIFINSISGDSGIKGECDFCGRIFFEDDAFAGEWEQGELEKLRQKALVDRDRYRGVDQVHRITINGKTGVVGCPCNALRKLEDMFWKNRRSIMDYISARVKDIVEHALEDEGLSDQAMADLEQEKKAVELVQCLKCRRGVSKLAVNEDGICISCADEDLEDGEVINCKICNQPMWRDSNEMTQWGMCQKCHDEEEQGLPF